MSQADGLVSPLVVAKLQRCGRALLERRAFGNKFASKIKVNRMVRRLRFAKRLQPLCKAYLVRKNLIRGAQLAKKMQRILMQRAGRGYLARKEMKRRLVAYLRLRRESLLSLQRMARGFIARRKLKRQRRLRAARRLQRTGRASIARHRLWKKLIEMRLRRLHATLKIQRVGRGFDCRLAVRQEQLEDLRRRRRYFFLYCRAPCDAFRVRKALGKLWLQRRYTLLKELAMNLQRMGQGYFDRRFLAPQYHHRRRYRWLVRCASTLQRIGRALVDRRSVFRLFALRVLKQRRLAVRRQMILGAASKLQAVGKGFARRRKVFRRWFRHQAAKRLVAAAFRGYVARLDCYHRLHAPQVERVRRDYPGIDSGGWEACFALRSQQEDLYQELDEINWRFDDMLNGNSYPVLKSFRPGPLGRLEAEVTELRRERRRITNTIDRARPEHVAAMQCKLSALHEEVETWSQQNAALEAKRSTLARRMEVNAADLKSFDALTSQRDAERADIERQLRTMDARRTKVLADTDAVHQQVAAYIEKAALIDTFVGSPAAAAGGVGFDAASSSAAPVPPTSDRSLTYDFSNMAMLMSESSLPPASPLFDRSSPASSHRGRQPAPHGKPVGLVARKLGVPPSSLTPEPGSASQKHRLPNALPEASQPASPTASSKLLRQRLGESNLHLRRPAFALMFPACFPASAAMSRSTTNVAVGSPGRSLLRGAHRPLIGESMRREPTSSLFPADDDGTAPSSNWDVVRPGPWLCRDILVTCSRDIASVRCRLGECDALIHGLEAAIGELQSEGRRRVEEGSLPTAIPELSLKSPKSNRSSSTSSEERPATGHSTRRDDTDSSATHDDDDDDGDGGRPLTP